MSKPLAVLSVLLPVFAILFLTGDPGGGADGGSQLARGRVPSVPRAWVPRKKSERWECIVIHHRDQRRLRLLFRNRVERMVLGIENAVTVHGAHAEGQSHLGNRCSAKVHSEPSG